MTKMCRLESINRRERPCPATDCAFWEPGGAVLEGRCMFDGVDLSPWPVLAADLLQIRAALEESAPGLQRPE